MELQIEIPELPHGHGGSFKRGISDGMFGNALDEQGQPNGHERSYRLGYERGEMMRAAVANMVRE
ncbi:hypothetical protein [Salipiger thiooxidans]|uniref:hypothetical protein n=1 Tax=Salipiger thiooxidans TaxID=282683 RepID=UPI001CFC21D7|nr:hypothetical protein [Salipiger thiooxidans]